MGAEAENFLGFAYATGEDVPRNYAKADYWRKKAAAGGAGRAGRNHPLR